MCIVIVTPVYNDWVSVNRLIREIDTAPSLDGLQIHMIVVNDGSTDRSGIDRSIGKLKRIRAIETIELVTNLGHQRALAVGLVHAAGLSDVDAVIVMDADGEDRPEELQNLIAAWRSKPDAVICAQRARRSEGITFRLYYHIYKFAFRMLTGTIIDFGNFCLIPKPLLRYIVSNGNTWNNLAAMLVRSRLPCVKVPTIRGERYAGQSKMNLISLILHGLSAIAVYCDVALARLLMLMVVSCGLAIFGVVAVTMLRFLTDLAVPGWASNVVGSLLIILLQSFIFSAISIFLLLNTRSSRSIIPAVEAQYYIAGIESHRTMTYPLSSVS
jgi:glycosyltransferase involved in cell wall biosynthesis